MKTVLRHLRTAALLQAGERLTDGQLLEAFVARRDEAAFAALVRRHGPMVLGVARRVVGNVADADDVLQATFLVLVTKAATVRPREALGNWLYGVAYRTALKVRTTAARRLAKERQVKEMARARAPEEDNGEELLRLLDQELSRLPDKYRLAVVLCDLEGRPRKQVARQFAIPEGTLSSRLTTARRLLAKRLARYGLAVSGGAVAALAGKASAAVSAALVVSTVTVGLRVAAGQAVPVTVPVSLSKEVVKTMFLAKLKLAVGALLVVTALGAGVSWQVGGPRAARAAEGKPLSEVEALRKENELLKYNLQLVLEKARALEADVRALKGQAKRAGVTKDVEFTLVPQVTVGDVVNLPATNVSQDSIVFDSSSSVTADPVQEAEAALKALREAKSPEARKRAAEALEKAVKKLREQPKGPEKPGKPQGK
jgi:RNA polymerase sigma factor (sigma-70 family)